MHVWLTRPAEDASSAAQELRLRGHKVHSAPLMEIAFKSHRLLDLGGVQAFLATSANGVRALLHHRPDGARLGLPVLCVGEATARTARESGFSETLCAEGDVTSLAALVRRSLQPANGRLLHVAGQARAGDLRSALQDDGFEVTIEVLYDAIPAQHLDDDTGALIKAGRLDAVLLYSPRTARIYADLIRRHGLAAYARRLRHLCLSPAVADALAPLAVPSGQVAIAARPQQDALLVLLD